MTENCLKGPVKMSKRLKARHKNDSMNQFQIAPFSEETEHTSKGSSELIETTD